MRAELTARSALTQSGLLPVTSDSVSSTPAYLPSRKRISIRFKSLSLLLIREQYQRLSLNEKVVLNITFLRFQPSFRDFGQNSIYWQKLPRKSSKSIPQWSSSSAISNHTLRDIRFDAITMTERWNAGTADNFELEGLIQILKTFRNYRFQ